MARRKQLVIVAINDDKTCATCAARDGEIIDADALPDYPSETCENFSRDIGPQCRCRLRRVRKKEEA